MSIAAAFAADKESALRPPPAESMAHRQTNDQVTIGADPFSTAAKTKVAFGKLDPNERGILPVLVVVQNDSKQTINTSRLEVRYKVPGVPAVENTPAPDLKFLNGAKKPGYVPAPIGGGGVVVKNKKNPFDVWQIEGRAFSAQMIPPGQTASGFFYFQADLKPGATISLDGLAQVPGGKQLFYFEIPLE